MNNYRFKKPEVLENFNNKSKKIQDFLNVIFPGSTDAIKQGNCPTCRKPITGFKDELSVKEYQISGMCQECQDSVFTE